MKLLSELAAAGLAWVVVMAFGGVLSAGMSWGKRTKAWNDRVRTNRLDPLRELSRWVEGVLTLGLAGAVAERTGWPVVGVAAVLLVWPLRLAGEIRTAVRLARSPEDPLALHQRGFHADTHGPLATRAAGVALAIALYATIPPWRQALDWLAGWAVRGAWWAVGAA